MGNRWLVEPISAREVKAGRPPSSAVAWAILALLSGDRPGWIHSSPLSRLKRRLRDRDWALQSLKGSESRARIFRWRALPSDIAKILKKPGLVLTGLSGVAGEIDLVPASGEIDAYVSSDVLRMIERQFQPAKESDEPNLTLRVPNQPWILKFPRAPLAVVSADLLLDSEPRVTRAGREALRKLLSDQHP
ncbi:MAG TPA: hypothetical protein VMU36_13785 [Spirochaetia bacterium]|nr:hypothetical protein [Spirochaetia bacterium]